MPTIFNGAVDAVVRHWVTVVAKYTSGPEGLGRLIQHPETYLYANHGLIASTQVGRLQQEFYALLNLFDHFGLWEKLCKTVRIVFQTCHPPGRISVEDCIFQMTVEGMTYLDRLR